MGTWASNMRRITIVLCALSIPLLFDSVDGRYCRKRPWQQLLDMWRERMGLGVLRCHYWCDSWSPEIGYERAGTPCEVDFGYGACFMGRCVPGIMRRCSLPLPYSLFDGYYGGGSSGWVPMSIGYDRPPRAPEVRSGYERPHLPFGPLGGGFQRVPPWRPARLRVIYDLPSDFQRRAQVLPGSFRAVLPKLVPYGPSGGMPSRGPSPKVPSRPTKKGRSTSPNVGSSAERITTMLLKAHPLQKPQMRIAPFNVHSRPTQKGRSTSPNDGRSAKGETTKSPKPRVATTAKPRTAPTKGPDESSISSDIDYA